MQFYIFQRQALSRIWYIIRIRVNSIHYLVFRMIRMKVDNKLTKFLLEFRTIVGIDRLFRCAEPDMARYPKRRIYIQTMTMHVKFAQKNVSNL